MNRAAAALVAVAAGAGAGAGVFGVGAWGASAAWVGAGASLGGCTISVVDSGAAEAGTQTVGDQCSMIGSALCNAYPSCALSAPNDCVTQFYAGCCSGSTCDELATSSASAVAACVAAYNPPDCNALANGATPSACSGIPSP